MLLKKVVVLGSVLFMAASCGKKTSSEDGPAGKFESDGDKRLVGEWKVSGMSGEDTEIFMTITDQGILKARVEGSSDDGKKTLEASTAIIVKKGELDLLSDLNAKSETFKDKGEDVYLYLKIKSGKAKYSFACDDEVKLTREKADTYTLIRNGTEGCKNAPMTKTPAMSKAEVMKTIIGKWKFEDDNVSTIEFTSDGRIKLRTEVESDTGMQIAEGEGTYTISEEGHFSCSAVNASKRVTFEGKDVVDGVAIIEYKNAKVTQSGATLHIEDRSMSYLTLIKQ